MEDPNLTPLGQEEWLAGRNPAESANKVRVKTRTQGEALEANAETLKTARQNATEASKAANAAEEVASTPTPVEKPFDSIIKKPFNGITPDRLFSYGKNYFVMQAIDFFVPETKGMAKFAGPVLQIGREQANNMLSQYPWFRKMVEKNMVDGGVRITRNELKAVQGALSALNNKEKTKK
jgi:hypothetical protein